MTNNNRVSYLGFATDEFALLRYPAFTEALENNDLILVDSEDEEIELPLRDEQYVLVLDPSSGESMYVLFDSETSADYTVEGFEDVLRAMDSYLKATYQERMFVGSDNELVDDSHEDYNKKYDFTAEDYVKN